MQAVVWTRYGAPEALKLREVPKPAPRPNELLVRVHATTASAGDCELRALRFDPGMRFLVRLLFGFFRPRPRVLGQEFSGVVEAVGRDVRRFGPGDPIFGTTGFRFGAYAEYLCVSEAGRGHAIAIKPSNATFEQAAAVPTGGLEALHHLRRAGDLTGRTVLVHGAAGGIGTFAVQLAKFFGAEVTGVDRAGKLNHLRSIGADHVLEGGPEEFTRSRTTYDVLFDVVGNLPFSRGLAALSDRGRYLLGNPTLFTRMRGFWASKGGGRRVLAGTSPQPVEDLLFLKGLIETGHLRAVVDRQYPLGEIVDAHRFVETGAVVGKVVLTVGPGPPLRGPDSGI